MMTLGCKGLRCMCIPKVMFLDEWLQKLEPKPTDRHRHRCNQTQYWPHLQVVKVQLCDCDNIKWRGMKSNVKLTVFIRVTV